MGMGTVKAWVIALVIVTAGLVGASAGATEARAASPSADALTCDQFVTPEFEALASGFSAEFQPFPPGAMGSSPSDSEPFLSRGGQFCEWFITGPSFTAYSPITEEDAAIEIARLEGAGLTRTELAEGISYELRDQPAFQIPAVWGHYLFSDGYWYLVQHTTSGSGGTSVIDTPPDVLLALREVVEAELGPSPALDVAEPDTDDVSPAPTAAPSAAPFFPEFTTSDPSVLSGLRTVGDVLADPRTLLLCTAGALVLTALVAIPTALLNSSIQSAYERVRDRFRRRSARVDTGSRRLPDAVSIALGLAGAALITTFVEPDVGLNGGSARLFLSTLLGFGIESLALLAIVAAVLRRRGAPVRLRMQLGSLLLVALAVLITRISGFEPGFLFGLVLALSFSPPPDETTSRAAARLELTLLAVFAVGAWLAYSALFPFSTPAADGVLFVSEALSAVAVGGLVGLVLLLIPVGDTPGAAIFRRNRLRWGVAFFAAVAGFSIVVLPLPDSWDRVDAPFVLWVALFAGYCVLAIVVWALSLLIARTSTPRSVERSRSAP